MFSFVLYDTYTEEAVAVRDHFGQKPLYYAVTTDKIVISSNIDSIASLVSSISPEHSS